MSKEILTFSRIKARKNCPQAEHYRYGLHLVSRFKKEALTIGAAVHKGLELGTVEGGLELFENTYPNDQNEQDNLEKQKATVDAMLTGYFAKWGKWDEDTEQEIEFKIPITNPKTKRKSKTFVLAGKIDGLTKIDGQYWLIEYKTASQISEGYFERLDLDDQITTYIYAIQKLRGIKIAGVIYRVVKKPTIKQTQKESVEQYCERLIKDYQERQDFYFFESKFYRSQEDLKRFELELWQFVQQFLYEKRNGINYRNTTRCLDWGKCEYMGLCAGHADAESMFEVKPPHEELNESGGI